jgi:hypothetical protein
VSYIIDALLRLSSTLKVGHVTCDNASNNRTMMKELAARLKGTMGMEYTWEKRKIKSVGYYLSKPLISLTHEQQLSRTCHQPGNAKAYFNL